ncbi:MAG TPA: hypothetical protein VFZ53_32325 [Polyangiaceae bacterium]
MRILGVLCALAGTLRAEGAAVFRVTRGPGAEGCPDEAALLASIEAIRGEAGDAARYRVTFSRDARGLSAAIRSTDGTSSRVLEDRGPGCAALAQATAVTLALLLDANAGPPKPPPAPPTTTQPADRTPPAASASEPSRSYATLALGGGALFGVLAPAAPALLGDAGIELSRFRTSVGALAVFPRSTELGPGEVRQSLASGFARLCLSPLRGASVRFDVCSGLYAGVLVGEGHGYTHDERAATPWLALPAELALRSVTPGFGWELGAAALIPIRRHEFAVDGVGVAYDPPAVGALVSLRAVGLWQL